MAELSIQRKKLSVLMPAKATAQIPKDSTFPLRKNCRDLGEAVHCYPFEELI